MQTTIPAHRQSPQYVNGLFENKPKPVTAKQTSLSDFIARYISEERIDAEPKAPIPLQAINYIDVLNTPDNTPVIYRLGHSSLLLKISGKVILIDPMFSNRASPFSFLGPKRFHPVPLNIEDFSNIDGVIISHDHYDHLDKETIKKLAKKTVQFFVPLGVGEYLTNWGVPEDKISELDWWEEAAIGEIKVTAAPAQHFSGRGLSDRNKTLWASWAIKTPAHNIFYSGDTGYFEGFKKIGTSLGPFDLAILENGAYDPQWPTVHMMPAETIQAHIDLTAKALMPVHNSTFDLAFHPWYDPLQQLSVLAKQRNVNLITPIIGQPYWLGEANNTPQWWQQN